MSCQNRLHNYGRPHRNRVESEEDYHTYVKHLEKKASIIDGPHFGNMQHAFNRVEVYEEVEEVEEEYEASGRFGRAKHMGRNGNNGRRHNTWKEEDTETVKYTEYKQDYLIRS